MAAAFERAGPRAHRELAVDRPDMAMDRAVGHVQLMADIPLGQIAVQKLEHPELPLRQLLIRGPVAADLQWPVEGSQPPGQDPRIRAGLQDGSRLGYRIRGTLRARPGPAAPAPG